jgi:hypothetical protein
MKCALTNPEKNALRKMWGVPGKEPSKATLNSLWTKGYLIHYPDGKLRPASKAHGFFDHDEICKLYHNSKAREKNSENEYFGISGRVPYWKNNPRRTKNFTRQKIWRTSKRGARADKRSFRTKKLKHGGRALFACPKGHWSPRTKRCKSAMKLYELLIPRGSRRSKSKR